MGHASGVEPAVSVPPPNLVRVSMPFWYRSSNVVMANSKNRSVTSRIVVTPAVRANPPCGTLIAKSSTRNQHSER